jgi:26S proteasome regulatory subunit N2
LPFFLQDFNYPKKYEIQCNSKPSVFAYPKKLEEKKEEKKKRIETVTLSTTAKEKARLARKRAKEGGSAMDIDGKEEGKESKDEDKSERKDEETKDGEKKDTEGDAMDVDAKDETSDGDKKPAKKKREPEPATFRIGNPARITIAQSAVCEFDLTQRYRPIRAEEKPFGVIILTDSTPGEEEELGAVKAPSLEPEGETAPPEPFEWVPPSTADSAAAMDTSDDKPAESTESKSDE